MAVTVYKKTAITGGAAGSLDSIDGAGLLAGDFAFVTVAGLLYIYILDETISGAESSPTKITPDANAGTKRWILQTYYLLDGLTSSMAELNLLDGSVAGTAVASKALVLGADKNVDTLAIAASGLRIGAGAGTAMTATAAELNKLAGLATTAAELGYVAGVGSAIQTQISAKAPTASPSFTGLVGLPVQQINAAPYASPVEVVSNTVMFIGNQGADRYITLSSFPIGGRYFIGGDGNAPTGTTDIGYLTLPYGYTFGNNYRRAAFTLTNNDYLDMIYVSGYKFMVLLNNGVTFSNP